MNTQFSSGSTPGPPNTMDDEISLLDYWRILHKHRKFIRNLALLTVGLTMVLSLSLPKLYVGRASLLPQLESKDSSLGAIGALLSATSGAAQGLGSLAQGMGMPLPNMPVTSNDVFVAMLKSRVMADAVIKKFDLRRYYGVRTMDDARQFLERDSKISTTKEKVIKIEVLMKDPKMAADMANFYVSQLDLLNRTVNVTKAGNNRGFLERRLAETQTALVRAEEALKEFQTTNKTVAVEAQAAVMIQAAAQLQAQITAQEVQLQVVTGYLSTDNPEVLRIRSSLDELRKQLYLMESGKGGKGMLPGDRMHPAMVTVPTLTLDYLRLLRELKVQESLYALLISQYEQAKIAEARDTPTVQVLDPAVPAERKSKPRTTFNMAASGAIALLLAACCALILEYRERLRQTRSASVTTT